MVNVDSFSAIVRLIITILDLDGIRNKKKKKLIKQSSLVIKQGSRV